MMRKLLLQQTILFSALLFVSMHVQAQIETPRPSPFARVMQTVGLTEIAVEYSSPGAKKRTIWGGLVPYGEMWRTGANKATMISFSRDVEIDGNTVKKGNYSLFTIPGKETWEIVLNKNTELWGTGNYSAEEDALRFNAVAQPCDHRERMTFLFSDFSNAATTLSLEWEKVRVSFTIKVSTDEQVMSSIESTLKPSARSYYRAAQYVYETHGANDMAFEWIDKSIEIESGWYNNWIKAQMLESTGDMKGAIKHAEIAKELGNKNPDGFFYKDRVESALTKWKEGQ